MGCDYSSLPKFQRFDVGAWMSNYIPSFDVNVIINACPNGPTGLVHMNPDTCILIILFTDLINVANYSKKNWDQNTNLLLVWGRLDTWPGGDNLVINWNTGGTCWSWYKSISKIRQGNKLTLRNQNTCRQTSNTRTTKSQNLNVSRFVLQLSLFNP